MAETRKIELRATTQKRQRCGRMTRASPHCCPISMLVVLALYCFMVETRKQTPNTAHKKSQHCEGVTHPLRIGFLVLRIQERVCLRSTLHHPHHLLDYPLEYLSKLNDLFLLIEFYSAILFLILVELVLLLNHCRIVRTSWLVR